MSVQVREAVYMLKKKKKEQKTFKSIKERAETWRVAKSTIQCSRKKNECTDSNTERPETPQETTQVHDSSSQHLTTVKEESRCIIVKVYIKEMSS